MTVMSHAIMQLINYHVYRDLDTSIYALNIMQNTECLWNMDKQLTSDHTLTVVFGNPEHNSSHITFIHATKHGWPVPWQNDFQRLGLRTEQQCSPQAPWWTLGHFTRDMSPWDRTLIPLIQKSWTAGYVRYLTEA